MKPKPGSRDGQLADTYRRLSPWLGRRLAARAGPGIDVDDLVQEAFVRFGRYREDASERHPKALLLRIGSNLHLDAIRRRSIRGGDRHVGLEEIDERADGSVDPAFLIDLKEAILSLPPKLRDALLLARFTPMTNAEIAERLGISTKAVEWRISRAVAICLARLES